MEEERRREEQRRQEEERRQRELQRLENLKNQAMRAQQTATSRTSKHVELKYYSNTDSRPGDVHGFGFGNVQTGQVSMRKISFLTRYC